MKRLVALLTAAILAALLAVPVAAANYTPVTGTYTQFDKYLILDEHAAVPNVEFNYTIEGTDGKTAAPGTTMEVIKTTGTTMPKMYQSTLYADAAAAAAAGKVNKITFVPTDTKTVSGDQSPSDWATVLEGEAFVKKSMRVDFSEITFDEPGIYRYKITESETTNPAIQGMEFDTQSTKKDRIRYLDVYVTDNSGVLAISSYVLHENDSNVEATAEYGSINDHSTKWTFNGTDYTSEAAAMEAAAAAVTVNASDSSKYDYNGVTYDSQADALNAAHDDIYVSAVELDDKSQGFVNEHVTYDMEFGKETEGNQGSKDKYFKFTLTLTGLTNGTVLQLDLGNPAAGGAEAAPPANSATKYEASVMAAANSVDDDGSADGKQLIADGTGRIVKDFYLKDGQYIAVKGIPKGVQYTLTEDAEDYKKADGTEEVQMKVLTATNTTLTNKHLDHVSGVIGNKEDYIPDDAGGYGIIDGHYHILTIDGTNAYVDAEKTTRYTGQRYKVNEKDVFTGFTNTRNGVIPTGVAIGVIGGIVLLVLAAGYFIIRRKIAAREEYED